MFHNYLREWFDHMKDGIDVELLQFSGNLVWFKKCLEHNWNNEAQNYYIKTDFISHSFGQ